MGNRDIHIGAQDSGHASEPHGPFALTFSRLRAALPSAAPWCLCILMAIGISLVPVSFFFHQLDNDALNYYLMAKQIVASGSPTAAKAINLPPFIYASGMSYIYAPFLYFFHSYPEQLRAIQFLNIGSAGIFFWLAIRYFRIAAPFANIRWLAIIFGAALLADLRLQQAVMTPNADIIPGVLTLAASLIACDRRRPFTSKFIWLIAISAAGFPIKFSLIMILPAFALTEVFQKDTRFKIGRQQGLLALVALAGGALLLFANFRVLVSYLSIFGSHSRYPLIGVPLADVAGHLVNSLANLWFAAMPDLVIPNLRLIFIDGIYASTTAFAPHHLSAHLILGLVLGMVISSCIVLGTCRLWRTRPYDVVLCLLTVPVFVLVPDSTYRYLIVFQPFAWMCLVYALRPLWSRITAKPILVLSALSGAVCALIFVGAKTLQIRAHDDTRWRVSPLFSYIDDVATVYGSAYDYLKRQPPARTRLVYMPSGVGEGICWQWVNETDLPLYSPRVGFPHWARGYRVLSVISCQKPHCGALTAARKLVTDEVKRGCYMLKPMQQWTNASATVEIDELVERPGCQADNKSS